MVPIMEAVLVLVMSFNIRYANLNDGINNWDNRKEIVVSLIEETQPDLIGMQEVRGTQLNYLAENMDEYGYFGKSRSEDPDDEHSPIFYNKSKFELIESNTFWLSETPEISSIGWDAAFNRIVTWGNFKHKETGKMFYFFNTHFDHMGETAKVESAKLLKEKIAEIAKEEDYIVSGDFNFESSAKGYSILTSQDSTDIILADVSQFNEETRSNIMGTFNGFDTDQVPTDPIDYIFVKPTLSVNSFKVIDKLYNGKFPSDHFPVAAELELEAK